MNRCLVDIVLFSATLAMMMMMKMMIIMLVVMWSIEVKNRRWFGYGHQCYDDNIDEETYERYWNNQQRDEIIIIGQHCSATILRYYWIEILSIKRSKFIS